MKIIFSRTLKKFKEDILDEDFGHISTSDDGKYSNIFTPVILLNILVLLIYIFVVSLVLIPLLFMTICHDLNKLYYTIYFYFKKRCIW